MTDEMDSRVLELTGHDLTAQDVQRVAEGLATVTIAPEAKARMRDSYALVLKIVASGRPTYGISTGFGEMSRVLISEDMNAALQLNLIRSHASGVGEPLSKDITRAVMLLRLNALCVGYSGINPEVTDLLCELINRGITPVIPEQGSLGASGDLANLAHMSLVLLGEGEAWVDGDRLHGAEALQKRGLKPVKLSGKDGLALINGTSVMLGIGVMTYLVADYCLHAANVAAALSFEALNGFTNAYDARIHEIGRASCRERV